MTSDDADTSGDAGSMSNPPAHSAGRSPVDDSISPPASAPQPSPPGTSPVATAAGSADPPRADPDTKSFDSDDLLAPADPTAALDRGQLPDPLQYRDPERYQILAEHGRGGLGRVFRAHDKELRRDVALKELLKPTHRSDVRFIREALITARLEHPGIVPVHEAGRWADGTPYYSMKLVAGRSLSEVIGEAKTLSERLALLPRLIAVADAIAYAHDREIIHRDLKPSNIILGDFGETIVIDWGLAKDLSVAHDPAEPTAGPYRLAPDGGGVTVAGEVVGTPTYMSPEQARSEPVGPATDIYALGAILYHLVAGRRPYSDLVSADPTEILTAVRNRQPSPLLSMMSEPCPADLAAVAERAMARAPADRYQSAAEFAAELRRFQAGERVAAHSYSLVAALRKTIRRHRGVAASIATAILVVAAIGTVSIFNIIAARGRAEREAARAAEESARAAEESARVHHTNASLILSQAEALLGKDPTLSLAWLKSHPLVGPGESAARRLAADAISRGVARHVFHSKVGLRKLAFLDEGQRFVVAMENGGLLIASIVEGGKLSTRTIPVLEHGMAYEVSQLVGNDVAVCGVGECRIVNISSGRTRRLYGLPPVGVYAMHVSPNRAWIAAAASNQLFVWSLQSGARQEPKRFPHSGDVTRFEFLSNNIIVSLDSAGYVRLLDIPSDRQESAVRAHRGIPGSLEALPDLGIVVSGGLEGNIRLWQLNGNTLQSKVELAGHHREVTDIALSRDGRRLLSGDADGVVRLWDLKDSSSRILVDRQIPIARVEIDPTGQYAAAADERGTIRRWDVKHGGHDDLLGHFSFIWSLEFTSDGHYLISADDGGELRVWKNRRKESIHHGHTQEPLDVAVRGSQVFTTGVDGRLRVLDTTSGKTLVFHESGATLYRVFPLSNSTALTFGNSSVRLWDIPTGRYNILFKGYALAVPSKDAKLVIGGHAVEESRLFLWSLPGEKARELGPVHRRGIDNIRFLPDNNRVVSLSRTGTLYLTSTTTGSFRVLAEGLGETRTLAVSPNGRFVAVGTDQSRVLLWEVDSGEVRQFSRHSTPINRVLFASDRLLVSGDQEGRVYLWNFEEVSSRELIGHSAPIQNIDIATSSGTIVTCGRDNTMIIWNREGDCIGMLRGHSQPVRVADISPDAGHFYTISPDLTLRIWPLDKKEQAPVNPRAFRQWIDSQTDMSTEERLTGTDQSDNSDSWHNTMSGDSKSVGWTNVEDDKRRYRRYEKPHN